MWGRLASPSCPVTLVEVCRATGKRELVRIVAMLPLLVRMRSGGTVALGHLGALGSRSSGNSAGRLNL